MSKDKTRYCVCGCGTELPNGTPMYNICGGICVPCYEKIVPKKYVGSFKAATIVENYVKKM